MNTELMGMTREQAMRMAADLSISGAAEHVVELLRNAQWNALVSIHGLEEARQLLVNGGAGTA
jgi:hypothetical protein